MAHDASAYEDKKGFNVFGTTFKDASVIHTYAKNEWLTKNIFAPNTSVSQYPLPMYEIEPEFHWIPGWGKFGRGTDVPLGNDIVGEAFGAYAMGKGFDLAVSGLLKIGGRMFAAKGGGSAFRYMTEAELKAVQNTGLLRGGRAGETFFTKDLYKSAASAQNRLALPSAPTLRVEFQILNNPTLLRNGTKVLPANGMMGRGAEFMTLDPVKVNLINWQPLR